MAFHHPWIAAAALFLAAPATAAPTAKVGRPAPDFTATTLDKQTLTRDDLKGKVVVLNLWATWCVPCKAEMPMMHSFQRKHEDKGFLIIGVPTEDSVPPYRLKKLDAALYYPLARRFKSRAYPILGGVPTSYVIDRKGVVRYAKSGALEPDEFEALILPLLAEKAQ